MWWLLACLLALGAEEPKKKLTVKERFAMARAVLEREGYSANDPRNVESRLVFSGTYQRLKFPDGPSNGGGAAFSTRLKIGGRTTLFTQIPLIYADNSQNGAESGFGMGDVRFSLFTLPWQAKDPFETVNSVLFGLDTFLPTGNMTTRSGAGLWSILASTGVGFTALPTMFFFPQVGFAGLFPNKGNPDTSISAGLNVQLAWLMLMARQRVFLNIIPGYQQYWGGTNDGATILLQGILGYQFSGQAVSLYYSHSLLNETGRNIQVNLSYTLFLGRGHAKKEKAAPAALHTVGLPTWTGRRP